MTINGVFLTSLMLIVPKITGAINTNEATMAITGIFNKIKAIIKENFYEFHWQTGGQSGTPLMKVSKLSPLLLIPSNIKVRVPSSVRA